MFVALNAGNFSVTIYSYNKHYEQLHAASHL